MNPDNTKLVTHIKYSISQKKLLPESSADSGNLDYVARSVLDLVFFDKVTLGIKIVNDGLSGTKPTSERFVLIATRDCSEELILKNIYEKVIIFRGSMTDFVNDILCCLIPFLVENKLELKFA